ncbi:hypothetical protein C2845_PM13G02650 [Panicum miliaceum]|uniref:Pectinesterase inhibitor domain-containing protein n=1 Tax=Panicum miliaceum TaxID=4540 RepID=A0A3L6RF38_PANMI|nr:hypothetical protein C2845_PM13G02650 [Panicum miliaceum]
MTTVVVVSLTAMFITRGAAAASIKAPTMTWSDACLKACNTPALYNLCQETLLHAPDAAEATVYALASARRAMDSYGTTAARAEQLLRGGGGGGSLPGVEQAAYWHCIGYYTEARSRMAVAAGDLSAGCVVEHTRLEYAQSVFAVQHCAGALTEFQDSPHAAMNAADYDLTVLAYDLGALIVGKQL